MGTDRGRMLTKSFTLRKNKPHADTHHHTTLTHNRHTWYEMSSSEPNWFEMSSYISQMSGFLDSCGQRWKFKWVGVYVFEIILSQWVEGCGQWKLLEHVAFGFGTQVQWQHSRKGDSSSHLLCSMNHSGCSLWSGRVDGYLILAPLIGWTSKCFNLRTSLSQRKEGLFTIQRSMRSWSQPSKRKGTDTAFGKSE